MKILNIALAILFVLFGYVQLNDPDAALWVSIYGIIAALLALGGFQHYYRSIYIMGITALAIWAAYLTPEVYHTFVNYDPDQVVDASVTHTANVQTEVFKEFGGLIISLGALILLNWESSKFKKA